jgi:hypothetical protein
MALLSDLGKHKKDDPAKGVTLSGDLQKQLRADLLSQRDGKPTTVIHQRVQALIDTSRTGSEDVAKAVTLSGEKVEDLGLKLDGLAQSMGNASALGGRIDQLELRLKAVEGGRPPLTGGNGSYAPSGVLSEDQMLCLRALTQIDAQLVDKKTSPDELSNNLSAKSKEPLALSALGLLREIDEDQTWLNLCAPVQSLDQVPSRIDLSYYLRGVVLRSTTLQSKIPQVV